jgi:hypothetical protein
MFHPVRSLVLVAPLLLGGCLATMTSNLTSRSTMLENTASSYDAVLRWSRWDAVLSHRHKDAPEVPDGLRLENVEVTGYDIRTRRAQVDEDTAIQKVEISYVLKDKQVLKKLKDDQLWRYDPETKQWWIYSALPDFR